MNITSMSQANGKDAVNIDGFTDDQKNAYNELIKFINDDYDEVNYKRALTGPAGTGKTYLIRALLKNCKIPYGNIGLSAPTHKACRVLQESINLPNIKVHTLQSDLGLRINFDVEKFDLNKIPFDPKGKIKIGDYRIYIIDESSMIPRGLVMFIEKLAKQHKTKLIYIGDASQLSPVGEKYSSAFRSTKTFKLKEIVRQGVDNPISILLELLRYDIEHKSFEFLNYIHKNRYAFNESNTKGYMVCNTEEFNRAVITNFNDEEFTKNVDLTKVVSYTNVSVNAWNNVIRSNIIKDSDKSVLTKHDLIISYTTIVDTFNDPIIKNSEEYIINDIVNYTHPKYGMKGFMVKFQAIHGGKITQPIFVVDHSDSYSIQLYVKLSNSMVEAAKKAPATTRATRWKEYFNFKEQHLLLTNVINNMGQILYSRDLDYGFALTSHKSQGSTFNVALVDINNICFDKYGTPYPDIEEMNRRLYVACSRAKDKLYLRYDR